MAAYTRLRRSKRLRENANRSAPTRLRCSNKHRVVKAKGYSARKDDNKSNLKTPQLNAEKTNVIITESTPARLQCSNKHRFVKDKGYSARNHDKKCVPKGSCNNSWKSNGIATDSSALSYKNISAPTRARYNAGQSDVRVIVSSARKHDSNFALTRSRNDAGQSDAIATDSSARNHASKFSQTRTRYNAGQSDIIAKEYSARKNANASARTRSYYNTRQRNVVATATSARNHDNKTARTRSHNNTRQNAAITVESPVRNHGNKTAATGQNVSMTAEANGIHDNKTAIKTIENGQKKEDVKKFSYDPRPETSGTQRVCRRSPRIKTMLEEGSDTRRESNKRSRRKSTPTSTAGNVAQDLRRRIKSIPIHHRRVPQTNKIRILARELKLRLASRCLPLEETGGRGCRVKVTAIPRRDRTVPMWGISKEQDPILLSEKYVLIENWRSIDPEE